MEYKILSSSSIKDLTFEVNDNIKIGWEPLGGIAITVIFYPGIERVITFYQTLIKTK